MTAYTPSQLSRMCTGKRAYPTHNDALGAAAGRCAHGAQMLRIYRCPACGKFHLTSRPDRFKTDWEG